MASADYWYVWIVVIGLALIASKWCHAQRRRHLARQQLIHSSSSQRPIAPVLASPSVPVSYTTVWVDGRLVYQPVYPAVALHVDPPPPYQQYPPGVAAVPAPFPSFPASAAAAAVGAAVPAQPLEYHAAPPSYRLSDKEGSEPVPAHMRRDDQSQRGEQQATVMQEQR